MNPTTTCRTDADRDDTSLAVVRRAVRTLSELDPETAGQLASLAFILMRVACADGTLCHEERARMESILVERAKIPPEHAVLVTEIACHRAALADCGVAYTISRELRSTADRVERASVIELLVAVATADHSLAAVERDEILQIANELGIAPSELDGRLPVSA